MELKSIAAFKEKESEIDNSKLGVYRNKLQEQLKYYQGQLERAKIVEHTFDIQAAKARIELIEEKLRQPIRVNGMQIEGIDESCLIPLAKEVWDEAEVYNNKYALEIQDAWLKASQAKELYLDKIKEIGRLRNEGYAIVSQANCTALVLRRNPLETIRIGRLDGFVVDYNLLDKLTR